MLLVNNHKLKMAAASTPGRKYNRRAAIIEGLRAGRSSTEIIRFFLDIRDQIYDVVVRYSASEQSNESLHESFGPKLALRQYRYVLVQGNLA